MEIVIIFAIIFLPFLLFAFWAYRANKKMPSSALAHLEPAVYRYEKRSISGVLEGFISVAAVFVLIFPLSVVFIKSDPVYIQPGVKELLVLIYFIGVFPAVFMFVGSFFYNKQVLKNTVLDLRPREGEIDWHTGEKSYYLKKDDFVKIEGQRRYGRSPELILEFFTREGFRLYLSFTHPGYEALTSMLKEIPKDIQERNFPLVSSGSAYVLKGLNRWFDWTKKSFFYEVLGIVFCLVSIYAMNYYEKNQRNLDHFFTAKELKVVGDDIRRGAKGRRLYYLWVHDGRFVYDVSVSKAYYEESIKSGLASLYYNPRSNRYVVKETDFGPMPFLKWALGILAVFLAGRIVWLWRRPK